MTEVLLLDPSDSVGPLPSDFLPLFSTISKMGEGTADNDSLVELSYV